MGTIAVIIVCFSLGLFARALVHDTTALVGVLDKFIIYISLPAVILLNLPQLEISTRVLAPAGFAWLWLVFGGLCVLMLSRWQKWPREIEGALLIMTVMGNTSFVGLPLIKAFFNNNTLGYAIFYDQLGSFLILSTTGLLLILLYSPYREAAKTPTVSSVILSVAKFPPMIALLIALTLPIDGLVASLATELGLLGQLLMPSALLVLGIQFRPKLLPEHRKPLMMGIGVKMLLAPLLAASYILGLDSDPDLASATVFQSAMPCMITPGLLAINAGIAPRLIAAMLGYSALFAFISLPVVYYLLVFSA